MFTSRASICLCTESPSQYNTGEKKKREINKWHKDGKNVAVIIEDSLMSVYAENPI